MFGLILRGLLQTFVLPEEIKRSSLLFGFPPDLCIPSPPFDQTYVSAWEGGGWRSKIKKVLIDRGREETEELIGVFGLTRGVTSAQINVSSESTEWKIIQTVLC